MILLLLEALDFLNICSWFKPLGHGLGFIGIYMKLCRFLWQGLVFLDIK
jgi:hypothetical protein